MYKELLARIEKINVSRSRVAREAGLCPATACNFFAGKVPSNPNHRRYIKNVSRIEKAVTALEKQAKKIPK